MYFSRFRTIEDSLGGQLGILQASIEPLDAFIAGPFDVPDDSPCTFRSNVWGGKAPYTYSWSGVLSGSTEDITGTVTTSGYLTLTVTDDESTQDSDTRWIDADPENDECVA